MYYPQQTFHGMLLTPVFLQKLTYIGEDLNNTKYQTWIVVVLSLVQGVLGPIISRASDVFQARKLLLLSTCAISFVGACIAPGSGGVYRLIGANVLIGVGFAAVPLAYAVPSEILPRRWRPCESQYERRCLATKSDRICSGAGYEQHRSRARDDLWPIHDWSVDEA